MATQEISAFSNFNGTNEQGYVIVGGSNGVEGGKKLLSDVIPVVPEQVQADWKQDDNTESSFIQNKPIIPSAPKWSSIGDGSGSIRLYDGYIKLNFDENSLTDANDTLAVKVPVPSPNDVEAPATDGDVLTFSGDDIVWAAPQGGGGDSLPEHTNNDIGKILGIEAEYDRNYNVTGHKLVWTPGLPTEKTNLGSGATDYGAELDIAAKFDNDGNPVFKFRETVPSYAYKFWEGTDADKYEVSWDNKNTTTWTRTVNNNQYTILETINEYDFDDPDITAPTRLNITLERVHTTPPNCLIEFANYSENDIDVYVSNKTRGSESSDCNVTYPMIPVGETYSDVHKAPAMSFISIQILGHGYTIKYRPLQQSETDYLKDGSNYTLCADASWNNPTIFC